MDSHETHEPSYYEVALTNRQVLIAFVALLTCLLVAFLSGVWIGRGGAEAAGIDRRTPAQQQAAVAAEPPLEQLSFFNGTDPGKTSPKPPVPAPSPAPAATAPAAPPTTAASAPATDASDTMRQNLEATMAANRETPAMKLAVGERTGTPPAPAAPRETAPATATQAAVKPAAAPPAKPEVRTPATGRTFVQVYSSNNGARAQEIVAQLRKAGFDVVMAESPKGGGKNYRVRVGPYESRAAADAAAIRLRRDHRLDTWVTDSP